VIEPPETINLESFTESEARLFAPDGTASETLSSTPDPGLDAAIVDFPNDVSLFTVEGVHRLRIILTGLTGYRQTIPDVPIVVQDLDSQWHTLDTAREEWADAGHLGDRTLWELLEVAKNDVTAFAPSLALADGTSKPVPVHYRKAQIMQARNILNSLGVDPASGDDGDGSFAIRPFPLDWQVKQTLRPKRVPPVVG
jgi:hypothetical protein